MDMVSGGQLAAEALVQKEVETIFTLSGGHITPIYQYLENTPITLFDTRHEQAAVFMAEAWGRMTRKPGVAMVTAGPGFTNALTAVANARFANTPLVLISGCVGINCIEKLDLQDMRQRPVIEPMVKKALICHKPERIPEFIDFAFRTAGSGRPGPVYLELPVDVLNTTVSPDGIKTPHTVIESHPVDLDKVEQILAMLEKATQPVIIAGSGAWYADGGSELVEFVENTGIPVFTSALGRGVISDTHPLCFESSLAIRPGAALVANTGADLVLFLGARMSLYYLFGDLFNAEAKIIQVDIEPEEIGRNRSVDLAVVSDVRELLKAGNRLIRGKKMREALRKQFAGWVSALEQADEEGKAPAKSDWQSENIPIHPLRLAYEINQFMNREGDIVVADGGDTQVWMGITRTVQNSGRYLDAGLYGCLGVGIPYANAAKLRYPDQRVCLIIGDGSVGFNFMEFETALRKNLPIVMVISNDLGWGMIRHSQELRIGHAIENGTYIGKVDYHKLIEALGGKGLYVEDSADIKPALQEAFAAGVAACINVMTDPTTVSPGSVALANLGGYTAQAR
ncbi:MAG: thiamine pyrophosphate-binding protein [Desulfobacterales bacterium]|jgi:acetolactate synthase-1/2/3 large subunit